MVTGFDAGQRIEKTVFLPAYDTSGLITSPLPIVNCAVMLCSMALGEDFSRIIRSPPGAVGPALSGFAPIVLTRCAYAIATSPFTVSVLDSLLLPLPQPLATTATPRAPAHAPRLRNLFILSSSSRCHGKPACALTRGFTQRGTEPRRAMQPPFGVDDHGVDARHRFHEPQPAVHAEHEHRLRHRLAGEAVVGEHRHAAHALGRAAGGRIDQVMAALAAVVEIALVVARRGDRDVLERQHRDDL